MRLWSIHPKYLDRIGLIALWREGLLAKKVLEGKTKRYRNHPQLIRFKNFEDPWLLISAYLFEVYLEAEKRGYHFDKSKIKPFKIAEAVEVTEGQLLYEFQHLLEKLKFRDPIHYEKLKEVDKVDANPVFKVVEGGLEPWEKLRGIY